MKIKFTAVIVLLLSSVAVSAETYLGFSYGTSDYDTPTFDDPNGYSLFGGYQQTDNLSFELSYTDFGDSKDSVPPVWTLDATTVGISARYQFPVSETFKLSVRLGLHMWDASVSEDGFGELGSDDGTDLFYGIGAAYSFTEKFSLGLEHNSYDTEDADISLTALRLEFKL